MKNARNGKRSGVLFGGKRPTLRGELAVVEKVAAVWMGTLQNVASTKKIDSRNPGCWEHKALHKTRKTSCFLSFPKWPFQDQQGNFFFIVNLGLPTVNRNQHLDLQDFLVGGFNPFEKYARQIGSFHQVGVNIKKCLSCHHPALIPNRKSCFILWLVKRPFVDSTTFGGCVGWTHKTSPRSFNLRTFQQTPKGAYQNDPQPRVYERFSFHLGVWGCLGYAPGVCWGSLRFNV